MSTNIPEFSVSELAGAVKRTIEDAYGFVRVRGEISKVFVSRPGHAYLTLKDADATLEAICWRARFAQLAVKPEEGLEVVCSGRLTTYPGRSQYQLVIEEVSLQGVGALLQQLELRKQRLAAEGLFAVERKRPLPFLPDLIGVITSPSGAVIRDILHRLEDRCPREVLVWPVAVQGERSPAEVAGAIEGFNSLPATGWPRRPEVVIVARGGGSIEDLWGFNDEAVVRAAAASAIPLISAIGHETDTTLLDLVADRRAPTPTGAAEMAVPVRADLLASLAQFRRRQTGAWQREGERRRREVAGLARGLPPAEALVERSAQRLDDVGERLPLVMQRLLEGSRSRVREAQRALRTPADRLREQEGRLTVAGTRLEERLNHRRRDFAMRVGGAATALRQAHPNGRIEPAANHLHGLERRRLQAGSSLGERAAKKLDHASRQLLAVSYERTLARGYVVARDPDGRLLPNAKVAARAQWLKLQFQDGELAASIDHAKGDKLKKGRSRRKQPGDRDTPGQGSLW